MTHEAVDLLKEAAISYGLIRARSFDHRPTKAELLALDQKAQEEMPVYQAEAAEAFDSEIEKIFPIQLT